jgi:hypothetical protein
MAVVIIDGRVRVTFALTIANIAAPTVAELNAGTALETSALPDGLDISVPTNGVDVSNLASTFTSERAGRRKPSITMKFHHDDTVDTAWNLLPYRTVGYLAVRMGIDRTTAYASTQKIKIYPVETGEPTDEAVKPDGTWDFMVPFFSMADANQRAVIA